jgi:hypothetical protein
MQIFGANPSTPGLGFIQTGPSYLTGGEEGWAKGNQQAWIMPGIEEVPERLRNARRLLVLP